MKILQKTVSLMLLLSLLFSFASCSEKTENVSKEGINHFNMAVSTYNSSSFRSLSKATVEAYKLGESAPFAGYVQGEEGLFHHLGNIKKQYRKIRYSSSKTPLQVEFDLMTPYAESYTKDSYCYYRFEDQTKKPFKVAFSEDYYSRLGLYSLGNRMPMGVYAVKKGDLYRVDLNFSEEVTRETQSVFANMMKSALFLQNSEMTFSGMTVTALFNEDYEMEWYSISFEGQTTYLGEELLLQFVYEEKFSDFNTKDEIEFPDFGNYESK